MSYFLGSSIISDILLLQTNVQWIFSESLNYNRDKSCRQPAQQTQATYKKIKLILDLYNILYPEKDWHTVFILFKIRSYF